MTDSGTIHSTLKDAFLDTEECSKYMEKHMIKSLETFKRKNPPYGNSAIRGVERYGIHSAIWRLYDKFNRIESLIYGTRNTVEDESLEDSLIDLANYCHIIAYAIQKIKKEEVISNEHKEN